MDILYLVLIFIVGVCVGSFLNVVSERYNTGLSIVSPRSRCATCNTELKWYELIPIISFIALRGKCATCKSPLSLQYPVVEFLTGVLFVGLALRQAYYWPIYSVFQNGMLYSVLFFLFYVLVFSLLIVIVLYDMKHKVIPNTFVYAFIILNVLKLFIFFYCKGFVLTQLDWYDLSAPFVLFIPFFFLWAVSKGRWLGLGDAKLVFGIGAMLGFVFGISAVVLAFWLGALWSVYLLLRSKFSKPQSALPSASPTAAETVTMYSEIPFAPFLVLSTAIVFLSHIDVLNLGTFLNLLK